MAASRRDFLAQVGGGMFIASLGPALAAEMGLCGEALAQAAPEGLTFGRFEPLVDLMQQTPPEALLPIAVQKLRQGVGADEIIAAAALANARAFGGEDYVGFHTLMALGPAYQMSAEMPAERRALPILKVLYRNASRLHERGPNDLLIPVESAESSATPQALRDAVRQKDIARAERIYAAMARGSAEDALNDLLLTVQDATEVHRVVLVWRAWSMLDLVGREHAHTMLRQSVRYCVNVESDRYAAGHGRVREVLPKLLDEYRLDAPPAGARAADDGWVQQMAEAIFAATPDQAAGMVGASLAEGIERDAISQAVSLAANELVLRDAGRPEKWSSPHKPAGSVHGDSIGVHACDAVNAWCNIARVSNSRNAAASLMLAAWEVARGRVSPAPGGDMAAWKPRPLEEDLVKVRGIDAHALLDEAESAIRNNDQALACAAIGRYAERGYPARPIFDLMLRYAVSQDGALHAEKYYRTVTEEFTRARPAFRGRHLVALARVTASAHGYAAPGYDQACELLNVSA